MVQRRKGISAAQSKDTSRRLRTATLGTHVPRSGRGHMNGEGVGFSNPRRQRRASRGFVENVMPGVGGASSAHGSIRRGGLEFASVGTRRPGLRRALVVVACLAVAAAIVAGVGSTVFFGSVDGKLSLGSSDAAAALVAPGSGEAPYTLVAADLDGLGRAGIADGPDALCLVRTDDGNRAATVLSIPADTQVSLKDGKQHQLREASADGDAALVSAVATLTGKNIAHFVKTDAPGIVELVDGLGGVSFDASEEVDDPKAGDVYIPAGSQTLDGQAALTVLRATNFSKGGETQAANQRALLSAIALRMADASGVDFLSSLDRTGGALSTDVNAKAALAAADSFRGLDPSSVQGAIIPGYWTEVDGESLYIPSTTKLADMMSRVDSGDSPTEQRSAQTVDPGSFTVTVRNGSDITGAASQMAQTLKSKGFDVVDTGNTDAKAYTETLVVYNDDAKEAAADTVVAALGSARTVPGQGYYTFDSDVLVILGKDWKPAS